MTKPCKIALIGLGNYAHFYWRALFEEAQRPISVIAGVDPMALSEGHGLGDLFRGKGIPLYADLAEQIAKDPADLYILCSPLHLHATQVQQVLAAGKSVLCEKPAATVVQDVDAMIAADRQASGFCAIGFQWSFSPAIQELKNDILAGRWGAMRQMKTIIGWPRNHAYYGRNDWAGQIRSTAGQLVLDSPIANATAHFLHNCFYLLGDDVRSCAAPTTLSAELYRANDITNFDAAALRCTMAEGGEILFYTAHCIDDEHPVQFSYEFERGTVTYNVAEDSANPVEIIGVHQDDGVINYGMPEGDNDGKIWQCVDAVQQGGQAVCGPSAARSQVLAVNAGQESQRHIVQLPNVQTMDAEGVPLTFMPGLLQDWEACFAAGKLPSESQLAPHYAAGQTIDVAAYQAFPLDF